MIKKILFVSILFVLLFSVSFSAIDLINYSSKFEKENVKKINSYNGFGVYENAKVKVYIQKHGYELKQVNRWDYKDYLRDFKSNYEGVEYFGGNYYVGNRFLGLDKKTKYRERRDDFSSQNKFKINKFNSKGLSYTNSENYNFNDFY